MFGFTRNTTYFAKWHSNKVNVWFLLLNSFTYLTSHNVQCWKWLHKLNLLTKIPSSQKQVHKSTTSHLQKFKTDLQTVSSDSLFQTAFSSTYLLWLWIQLMHMQYGNVVVEWVQVGLFYSQEYLSTKSGQCLPSHSRVTCAPNVGAPACWLLTYEVIIRCDERWWSDTRTWTRRRSVRDTSALVPKCPLDTSAPS